MTEKTDRRSEAEQFFDGAFAVARAIAALRPPPRPRPQPKPRPSFAHAICDRCGTGVRQGAAGRYVSVVSAPNGDPGKCSSLVWWRTVEPGVIDAHPDDALIETEEPPEWDECPGCLCFLGMAPCNHCVDHWDADNDVISCEGSAR